MFILYEFMQFINHILITKYINNKRFIVYIIKNMYCI